MQKMLVWFVVNRWGKDFSSDYNHTIKIYHFKTQFHLFFGNHANCYGIVAYSYTTVFTSFICWLSTVENRCDATCKDPVLCRILNKCFGICFFVFFTVKVHMCPLVDNFTLWGILLLSSPHSLTSVKWLPLIMPLTTALQSSRAPSRDRE